MEPLSIWGFTLIAMGFGAAYACVAKRSGQDTFSALKPETIKAKADMSDLEKERAIDELIAQNDSTTTEKGR